MYELKVIDGKVPALLKAGEDLVKTSVSELFARELLAEDEVKDSDIADYPILVEGIGTWYFAGKKVRKGKKND